MRTFSIVTRLDVSAEHYWALRDDVGFDIFCACEDGASYQLHEKSTDSRGRTVVDASYVYEKVPAVIAPAVGSIAHL